MPVSLLLLSGQVAFQHVLPFFKSLSFLRPETLESWLRNRYVNPKFPKRLAIHAVAVAGSLRQPTDGIARSRWAQLTQLQSLDLSDNQLMALPEWWAISRSCSRWISPKTD